MCQQGSKHARFLFPMKFTKHTLHSELGTFSILCLCFSPLYIVAPSSVRASISPYMNCNQGNRVYAHLTSSEASSAFCNNLVSISSKDSSTFESKLAIRANAKTLALAYTASPAMASFSCRQSVKNCCQRSSQFWGRKISCTQLTQPGSQKYEDDQFPSIGIDVSTFRTPK